MIISFLIASCSLEGALEQREAEFETLTLAAESPTDTPSLLTRWSVLTSTNIFGDEVRNYDMTYLPRALEKGATLPLKSGEGGSDEAIQVEDAATYSG